MEDLAPVLAAIAIFAAGSFLSLRYPAWRFSRPALVATMAFAAYFSYLAIQAAPHTRSPFLLMVVLSLSGLRRHWVHFRELRVK
jgi:hypothetical protein